MKAGFLGGIACRIPTTLDDSILESEELD